MEYVHVVHPFEPVFDERSRILILGTLPSVKSRENDFYYGHPRNRFWQVMASVCREAVPMTIPEKREMLLRNGIALWDVIAACDILGSSDSSIRCPEPTDLRRILETGSIIGIFANGAKAGQLYERYQQPLTGLPITVLPSTSPANAGYSLEKLCAIWQQIAPIK